MVMKNNIKNLLEDVMPEVLPEKEPLQSKEEEEYWRGFQEGFDECFKKCEDKIKDFDRELREINCSDWKSLNAFLKLDFTPDYLTAWKVAERMKRKVLGEE